ncbi:M23 family metallopeptidase [Parvibaculum sp.]|uniref:M23 family metallopeptidase n=1 Tax=Parvibaculum sp. TaxID=2024848 RepID=UPI0032EF97DC
MLTHLLMIVLFAVFAGLPLFYAWRVFRLDEAARGGWLVRVAEAALLLLLFLALGRWDMAGLYTRWVLVALLAAAALLSWRRHACRPWRVAAGPSFWRAHLSPLAGIAILGGLLVWIALGVFSAPAPHALRFPLEGGRFAVVQGGAHMLLNRHYGHPAQRYAADIVAVGPAGFRARGLLPDDPSRYAIFGLRVVSPCAGDVVEAADGLPDLRPPRMDPENPAGNHVVVRCEGKGIRVLLAHLQRGSLAVAEGARVEAGDLLGLAGNSGNTSEPHLHIHAVDAATGLGVPMAFDGRVPLRNRLFRR